VYANSFKASLDITRMVKYDVEFNPPLPEDAAIAREDRVREVKRQLSEVYGTTHLDNTRIFAPNLIKEERTFRGATGTVTLKPGQIHDMNDIDLQHKQMLAHITLQTALRASGLIRLGRNHYEGTEQWKEINIENLAPGFSNLRLWPGYRVSIEPSDMGLQLCVDVCHRLLEKRSVRGFMDQRWQMLYNEITRRDPNISEDQFNKQFQKNINDELSGRATLTLYNKRVWRIDYVDFDKTINDTFPMDSKDGQEAQQISFKDYFQQRYNTECTNTYSGMLVHLPKIRKMDHGNQRKVYIVPELAYLTGYSKNMRKMPKVTRVISDNTRIPAQRRWSMAENIVKRISDAIDSENSGSGSKSVFPLKIDPKPIEVQGRILDPYKIFLKVNGDMEIHGPSDLQRTWGRSGFIETGASIRNWGIVFEPRSKQDAIKVKQALTQHAQKMGLVGKGFFDNGKPYEVSLQQGVPRNRAWRNFLKNNVLTNPDIQALFCIMPRGATDQDLEDIYSAIKTECTVNAGVYTQCVKAENAQNRHVMNGILKQMFVKLGAIPWKVKFELPDQVMSLDVPTMLVGMDTNHDRKSTTSTCAMVATYDRDFVRYYSQVSYQQLGQEIIDDCKRFFGNALDNFKKVNGIYPAQLVIYRDGVSSTQLEAVYQQEINSIYQAFSQCQIPKNQFPRILFVVVQKRVVARFINKMNYQTVPPGTVIAETVVSNQFWDFFLVPCSPPPGCTATPTRFIVVKDELDLSNKGGQNDLECFTNQMCNLYYNWPGSIRVPACVKYSYKLAQQFSQSMVSKQAHESLALSYHFL